MTIPQFNEAANEYMGSTFDLSFSHLAIIVCVSAWQAGVSTFLSLTVALVMVHYGRASNLLSLCMAYLAPFCAVLPSWLAVVSMEYAYHLEGLYAIIAAHMMLNIPLCWYVLNDIYHHGDTLLYLTARGLGATSWQAYRSIVIPQVKDSVRSLALLVFILCFSSITIPKYAATIYYHHTINSALSVACDMHDYTMGVCAWLVRVLCIVCLVYCCGMKRVSMPRAHYYDAPMRDTKHIRGFLGALALWALFIIIPLSVIFWLCIKYCAVYWYTPLLHPTYASLTVALVSSTLAMLLATSCVALTFVFSSRVIRVIEFIALLPFIVGSVAIGMCCGLMSNGYASLVVSHALINYPLAYACMRAYMQKFSYEWILQARSMGASYATVMRTIIVPHAYAACMRAWVLAGCMSLTEVGAAHAVQKRGLVTLAMLLRECRAGGDMRGVMQVSVLVLVCTLVVAAIPRVLQLTIQFLVQVGLAMKRLLPLPIQILYRFRQGV